jgi:hypothetical protein
LRCKFEEALPKGADIVGSKAAIGFDYCNRLFDLEREWADLTTDERQKRRLEHSKPVLDEFWQWLTALNLLQNSNLGKVVTYALNQKEALNNFLYMYLVLLLTKLPGLKELTAESLNSYLPWSPELPDWCRNTADSKTLQD